MGNASALAGLLLLFGAAAATPASAQTVTADGAYSKLSPGNAKIARALYEAQVTSPAPARTGRSTGPTGAGAGAGVAPRPLTLDQIAAHKQVGEGWGQIFNSMKAQGLLHDTTLRHVVSRYQRHSASASGVVTTAANRVERGVAAREVRSDEGGNPGKVK